MGYEVNGYRFCYGAEDIEGLGEKGEVTYLLGQLGIDRSALFVPNTHTFLDGTKTITVGVEKNAFEEALIQTFKKDEADIRRFFIKAREVYDEGFDSEMVKKWGIILPQELLPSVMSEAWNKDYPTTHKNLLEWAKKPYQDVLDEYFTNQDIKTALCGFVPYVGAKPFNTPASDIVLHVFGYFFSGGYQAIGTPMRFAEVLASYIKTNRGEVLCNHHVEKILVDKTGVRGVRVGTDEFFAPVVVSNVNAKTTYFDLLDPEVVPPAFLNALFNLPLGNSTLALHLAVDDPLSDYTSVVQDRYNFTYIAIPTKNDPSLAPEGKSTVIVRETVRFTNFIQNTKEEEEQYLKDRTADLLEKATALVPQLAKGAVIKKVVTPHTYAELANIPYGAVYGFDVANSRLKLYFRSPIPGLYLSNASLGHAGVDGVISSGILCSHDIMGWTGNK